MDRWIADKYGSRRGLINTVLSQISYNLGKYSDYLRIDWNSVDRLVFICTGNICRSAFAETVARSLDVPAVSCGIDTIIDAAANDDAARTAKELGYDLERHKTTPFMYLVLKKTDLIIVMEPGQAIFLQDRLQRKHQFTLLGLWSKPKLPYLHDPYGTGPKYFLNCFHVIKQSVDEIVSKRKKET